MFSALYGMGLSCKKFFCRHPNKLPAKVISIGNLTLGGTGKTPAVISVAEEAKKRGYNPCILTRGYKGKAKDISFVSKGEGPLMSSLEAGDEAYLVAERLKNIPIVKCADRYEGGKYALNSLPLTPNSVFILDDGFQHWQLHRDIDVLLIDATNPFGNERLFPEGILREPLSALKRPDIIVITKADMAPKDAISRITLKIREHNPQVPIYSASHRAVGLINNSGEVRVLDALRNKHIYAFSGIANPAYFQATLRASGATIVDFMNFKDHHTYRQKDLNMIKAAAAGLEIITTEKDLVKLKELDMPKNLSALKIEFTIDKDFYDTLFDIITKSVHS